MGAKKTAVILKNATPLYSAYNDENNFADGEVISETGPIPVKIIQAIWKLSS